MSGLRIPILLGSIGSLIVLVLQNRTPVIQLTFLGMRSRPFSLGLWVTLALIIGVIVGFMVQMGSALGAKPVEARTANRTSKRANSQPQGFRSNPTQDFEPTPFEPTPLETEPTIDSTSAQNYGWESPTSTSWNGEQERGSEFWAAPEKPKARPRAQRRDDGGLAKNQYPTPGPSTNRISLERDDTMPTPVVEAEYRVVTPYSRFEGQDDDEFDDAFFDEFFDEEK